MCNYILGNGIECFGDGHLWDADDDGVDPNEARTPCPACNTKEYLLECKETAEEISSFWRSGMAEAGTGETFWLNAVRTAEAANKDEAAKALVEIGIVCPISPDPNNPAGYLTATYIYNNGVQGQKLALPNQV